MGNPYPANFIDESGVERLIGEINFTDGGNQPGGGGSYTYTGDGSPAGVQVAAAIGNTYLDSTNGASYFATSADDAGWVLVAGNGQETDTGVYSPPGTALLGDGTGAFVQVTAGSVIAAGAASGDSVQLGDYGNHPGVVVSNVSTAVAVGIYDATPVVQADAPTLVDTTTPTNVAPYGFTLAQAEALIAAVNALIAAVSAGNGGIGITA